jgi:hypothetical protein
MRFLLLACLLCSSLHAGFPQFSLYTLGGDECVVPRGKTELVFFGFDLGAKTELQLWYRMLRRERTLADHLGCTVIPVLPTCFSNCVVRKPVVSLINHTIPKELQEHVLLLFSEKEEVAKTLGLPPEKEALSKLHVFLIGKRGNVLWRGCGDPTAQTVLILQKLWQSDQS